MEFSANFDVVGPVLQICLIDLLLSGDNAILIALACRALPEDTRRKAIVLGTAAAVVFRVLMTFVATLALRAPYLKLIGALLLVLIAIELIASGTPQEPRGSDAAAGRGGGVWKAIGMIVVADAVMSLDNVVAVAAAAQDQVLYLLFGLLLSVPILVFASLAITNLLAREPLLVLCGAALLGWIAGNTAVADPAVAATLRSQSFGLVALAPLLGAAYVVIQGRRLGARRAAAAGHAGGMRVAEAPALPPARPATVTPSPVEDSFAIEAQGTLASGADAAGAAMLAATAPDASVAPAIAAVEEPERRNLSAMDLTILAGVAVPVLGLVATLIYIIFKLLAAH